MTEKELTALEKVFIAEATNCLPFQSKAEIFDQLTQKGLVKPVEELVSGKLVAGFTLTNQGHAQYCAACNFQDF